VTDLGYFEAILLGVIQGLTEFLPISSSGHLALTQRWLELQPDSPTMLLFDVLVHLGTLAAVLIVFAAPALRFAGRLVRECGSSWTGNRHGWRIVGLAIAATIPTAVIGLVFQDWFESSFGSSVSIGVCLIITGFLLAMLGVVGRGRRGWARFGWAEGVLIGVAQALAILPGISRSGATICMGSYMGWRREWAAQFSFLIAVPAICGGTLLKVLDTFALPAGQLSQIPWGPLITGSFVSLFVGVIALKLLLSAVRRAKLHYFAPYCWVVGVVVLVSRI
jgi:undecaprenyl-diphosphatase